MAYVFPFNDLSDYQFKHMDAPLFLPEELGRIVNAYAKPRLRYKKEYDEVLKAFGLKRWPELGRKLCERNHVLSSLIKVFLVAKKNADRVENMARLYQEELDAGPDAIAIQAEEIANTMHTLFQEVYGNASTAVLVAAYDGKRPPHRWFANYM